MKLLFDQNLSFKLCIELNDLFPGSAHVGRLGLGNADDRTIWRAALLGSYAIVTQDSDFAELAVLLNPAPKVIWLRCGNRPTAHVAKLLRLKHPAISSLAESEASCLEIYGED